jgi:hypothetical protein
MTMFVESGCETVEKEMKEVGRLRYPSKPTLSTDAVASRVESDQLQLLSLKFSERKVSLQLGLAHG